MASTGQSVAPFAADPLAGYAGGDPSGDVFSSAAPDLADCWKQFVAGLSRQGGGGLAGLQPYLDRHVGDLGLAFRVAGDKGERPWPLNPLPIFISAGEWAGIERGLIQRADLLETVIADIYGPQRLVADGHLPAAVISGSDDFARRMTGVQPPGGHYLHVLGIDLARGPQGEWRVLADRARLPHGIGYALENRLAIARVTGGLLASLGTRRQTAFFEALRQGLAASCYRSDPRIALLTPGRFNQFYPEQALLARHLGVSLVEGRDLTVRDEKLFVRTIAGLKRVDGLWRWITTRDIDPLNFDARSQIGVPGLVNAAADGLALANWPGVGVVESRAMPAFLPQLAQVLLGEPLALPNAATWWLGGEQERRHVLDNFDELMIAPAFRKLLPGLPEGQAREGGSLAADDRAAVLSAIEARPLDFSAQEVVRYSTAPAVIGGRIEPRAFTMRAFLARDGQGNWTVLPGGFARISQTDHQRSSLMGLGDIATDLCVVDPATRHEVTTTPGMAAPALRRDQGLLPSQAADNLFWLGRYCERAHQVSRIVRNLVEQIAIAGGGVDAASAITRLANLLRDLGAVPPESRGWQPSQLAGAALGSTAMPGSAHSALDAVRELALLLRDRLSRDAWRIIQRPMPAVAEGDIEAISGVCDRLIERFSALTGLMSDTLVRGPAVQFLDVGRSLERCSIMAQAARALALGGASHEDLSALVDLVDGQNVYRSRYLVLPSRAPVLDMVLLDPAQPRSMAHQMLRLIDRLGALPSLRDDGMIEEPLRIARGMNARLEGLGAGRIDRAIVEGLLRDLFALSDAIGNRYFLQDHGPQSKITASLLG
ncbi:circularly permuted type 2 ATP-grasp protein [Aurantiacibacter suaedae]|uniref:circularly permuted type 2 ATP-grasp protein n=1 Tax=Aurantiacibacter suaedae TaxID=2545755 RepID=UPI0010F7EA24|nr:circularly permuted type 2 ATP-grasp protein [Aurantiacibacter suaedae]